MEKPVYSREDEKKVLEIIVGGIESQFKINPHDEITYTISNKQIRNELKSHNKNSFPINSKQKKLSAKRISVIIRNFLKAKGKKSNVKKRGPLGSRYIITVTRKESEEWKKDIEILEKEGIYDSL